MSMKAFRAFAVFVVFSAAMGASAQQQISTTTYTQPFDSLAATGTSSTLPTGWTFIETGTNANTFYSAGNGSATGGDTYSFGSTAAPGDRAFGGLLSGSLTPTIGAQFVNTTGATIVGLQISYTGEQWRLGAASRSLEPKIDRLDFQYSWTASSLTSGTWIDVNDLDFSSPFNTTVGLVDGNAAANRRSLSSTITGLTIPNNATFWIRWTDLNASSSDDGLAVDDFNLTALTQPGGPTDPVSTKPTGTGSATPSSVVPGGVSLLTVTVTPGTNPTSTFINVTADLSTIGGSSNQSFSPAGNNTFSYSATVGINTSAGAKTLPVTITDAESRTGTASIGLTVEPPIGPVNHLVISQVYGGGGNSGAPYRNDFVELFNPTTASVNVNGWSVQYSSATGNSWAGGTQPLGGIIGPGQYFLIALGGGTTGSALPEPNVSNGTINLSGTQGKVALVSNGTPLEVNCPLADPDLVDFVGFGGADCKEGSATASGASNTAAIFRRNNGNTDTNQNGADFTSATPNPRRTAPIAEVGPSVFSTDPSATSTTAPRDGSVIVNFTEPVTVSGNWYDINCASTGSHNSATVASGGSRAWVITPNVNFVAGEQCTVTIFKDQVRDTDTDDSEPGTDALKADVTWTFSVATGAAPLYPSDVHLLMGNPTDAVNDVRFPNNYLMEKPELALSYNQQRGTPNWVSWHLASEWIGTLQRNDSFRPDPAVPPTWYRVLGSDYTNSGFDRGHMVPNADRDPETSLPINQATFLMTNIIPQSPDNNQGPWAAMENDLRAMIAGTSNEMYIVAGGHGTGGTGSNGFATTVANGNVFVPAQTWKVVLLLPKGDDDINRVNASTRTIAVLMPNIQGIKTNLWTNYITTVDAIESLTGYDFFENVSDSVENAIEAGTNGSNPPGAANSSTSTSEDVTATFTLDGVGSGNLTYTIVTPPSHGTLSGSGANQTYTPAPDYNGSDSFTFKVSNSNGTSNTATVSITVLEVNDAPGAANDPASTNEDQTVTIAAATLTANDSKGPANESTQTLTVTEVAATADTHGTVTLSNGQVSYTPAANYNGAASFSYRVCDNGITRGASDSLCATGTVNVTVASVNDAPTVSIAAPAPSVEGSAVAATATVTDVDANESFTYAWTVTKNGVAFGAATSTSFSFTPDDNGTYAVSLTVTDSNGGSGSGSASVAVSNAAPVIQAVSGPTAAIQLGGNATVTVSYSDAGAADTHTATFLWDDGTSSTVACANGVCSGTRVYTGTGVYGVTITVTDDDGASATTRFDFVRIYDVNGGSVTGGGFLENTSGKVHFNVNARHQKNGPDGNTQLNADGLDFKSTSYEWLLVSGSRAQYSGTGTVNGQGGYGFLVTVTDGEVDTFRMKIWNRSTGVVFYDNVPGASDDIDAANPQAIASGSITIHAK